MIGITLPPMFGQYVLYGVIAIVLPFLILWVWYETSYWKKNIIIFDGGLAKKVKGRVKNDTKGKHVLIRSGMFGSKELLYSNNRMMIDGKEYYLYFRDKQGFLVPIEVLNGKIVFKRDPNVEKVLRQMFASATLDFATRYKPQNKWILVSAVAIVLVLFGLGIFSAMVLQSFSNMYKKNAEQAMQLAKTNEIISKQIDLQQKTLNATLVLLNTTLETEKNLGLVGVPSPKVSANGNSTR